MIPFLHAYTEHFVELRACHNTDRKQKGQRIWTRDQEDIEDFIAAWDGKDYGVYFGIATRRKGGGTLADTMELPAVFIDIDHDTPPLELFTQCAKPPSLIVESGGGLHCYWKFTEPLDVSGLEHRDMTHPAYALLDGLRRIFNSDPAVVDVARIMRIAGTHNTKYETPREVRIVHQSDAEYEIDDLLDWCSWQPQLRGEPADPFLMAAEKLGYKAPLDLEELLAGMEYPGNVHEVQLKASAHLLSKGVEPETIIEEILAATKLAVGAAGTRWDWQAERSRIEEMTISAQKKFGSVVNLEAERKKRVNGADEVTGKEPVMVRLARIAIEAWGKPLITVGGELWTYDGGIWERFTPELEHELRATLQGACEAMRKTPNASNLNGAYRYILERPELIRRGVQWDTKPIVVARNGVLEIETGKIRSHSQDDWATRRVDCDLVAGARCSVWEKFLADSLPDGGVEVVQEWFGSALIRHKPREITKGLIAFGPSRSGKTQVSQVMRRLIGGRTCGMKARDLEGPFGLQPLVDASGWIADDAVEKNEPLNAERYKVIVTGEPTSVARKNKTNIECEFDFPVLLTANNLPKVKDDSDAVYNRSLVLPMQKVHPETLGYERPIYEKVDLGGVLNWALEGWARLRDRGYFAPCDAMRHAVDAFKADNSPLTAWMQTAIQPADNWMVDRRDLVASLNGWMIEEFGRSVKQWGARSVIPMVRQIMPGVTDHKLGGSRYLTGLKLTPDGIASIETLRSQNFSETVGSGRPDEEINKPYRTPKKAPF